MTDLDLSKYASLILNKGVNLLKGQGVIIYSSIEALPLVNVLVEQANQLGAKKVITRLSDEEEIRYYAYHLDELHLEKEDVSDIDSFVRIRIRSEGLNYLEDIDNDKLREYNAFIKVFNKEINQKVHQWTIVSYPGVSWAKSIFKDVEDEVAVNSLWELIKKAVKLDGDPITNWTSHNKNLHDRCNYLNSLKIKTLHYKSSNGTDFHISLKENINFIGGSVIDINGQEYIPNMPSEEVYTSPIRDSAEGVIYSTKPLFIFGEVISNFGFKFSKGEVIEILGDETAKEIFSYIFNHYPNSSLLGEVALVPKNSSINEIGILFYKNLLDENASCHLALGDSIIECIKDYDKLSQEELDSYELNYSNIHIDFMIGTDDLEITADTYDNKHIEIFKNGKWSS